jgi:hypothetical protein
MAIELENYPTLRNDAALVHYWRLEQNALDSKGSNNGLEDVTYSLLDGKFGYGALFNSALARHIDFVGLPYGTTGTINLWYKTTVGGWLFYDYPLENAQAFQIASNAGLYYASWYFQSNDILGGGPDPSFAAFFTGDWTMLTLTWDAAPYQKIYINGQPFFSASNVLSLAQPSSFTLGWSWDFYLGFDGSIDDVSYFNRTLSEAEILSYYMSGIRRCSRITTPMG